MPDVTSQGVLSVVARNSIAASLLIDETCEGTGTPTGWTDTGPVDWDETTTVLAGTQSMKQSNSASAVYTQKTITDSANLYAKFMWRVNSDTTDNRPVISFLTSGATELARLQVDDTVLEAFHGTASNFSASSEYAADTTYYLWFEYEAGSGSDGVCNVYINTADSKPGAASCAITTGTSTGNVGIVRLGGGAYALDNWFDNIQVRNTSAFS